MKLEKTKNTLNNTLWGAIYKIITIIMPFVVRTAIIYTLGSEYAGVGNLFTSILTVLSFAELGLSNAVVYLMYKPISEDNKEEICSLLGLYKKIYKIIGAIIFISGILVSPFIKYLISGSYPNDINLYILFYIFLANSVLSYSFFAYKKSIIYAYQRIDIESKISALVMFFVYVIEICIVILARNFYLYSICLPISTLVINLLVAREVDIKYSWAIPKSKIDKHLVSEIINKTKFLVGHKLGFVATNSEDNIIISCFLGLSVLTIYNNYGYIITAVSGFVMVFYRSILAGIGNSIVCEKREKNYNDFINISFVNFWIIGWCSICLICLFQPFIQIWMGDKMLLDNNTVITLVASFYFMQTRNIVLTYKDALGMWDKDAFKPYLILIINLILNIILVQVIGVKGVVIATLLTSVFIGIPWETLVLHKYYFGVSSKKYLIMYIICISITVICGVFTFKVIDLITVDNKFVSFIIKLIMCIVIPNIIFLLVSYRTKQFKYLKSHIKLLL